MRNSSDGGGYGAADMGSGFGGGGMGNSMGSNMGTGNIGGGYGNGGGSYGSGNMGGGGYSSMGGSMGTGGMGGGNLGGSGSMSGGGMGSGSMAGGNMGGGMGGSYGSPGGQYAANQQYSNNSSMGGSGYSMGGGSQAGGYGSQGEWHRVYRDKHSDEHSWFTWLATGWKWSLAYDLLLWTEVQRIDVPGVCTWEVGLVLSQLDDTTKSWPVCCMHRFKQWKQRSMLAKIGWIWQKFGASQAW